MWLVDPLLRRLASPDDRKLLRESPGMITRMRVTARIGLRFFWIYVVILFVLGVVVFASGLDIYHRTEVPAFCSQCHEMKANLRFWKAPLHRSLSCADCHTRPGLTGWVSAKVGGLRQAAVHFTAGTEGDIKMTEDQYVITSENCGRCHMGAARLSERHGLVISHEHHLEIGVRCVECHSRIFAHPVETEGSKTELDWKPPLFDVGHCFECHDGERRFGGAVAFRQDDEGNCTRCHPDAKLGNRHGGADLDCTDCHELAEYGPKGHELRHYPVVAEEVAEGICGICHDDVLEESYASMHMPFQEGQCLRCHRVMSPSHLYLTGSEPTADTCLLGGCHANVSGILAGDPKAGLSLFSDGDVDLHRRHGAFLQDDRKWCMLCHATHGSEAPIAQIRLLAIVGDGAGEGSGTFEVTESGGTCTGACHGERTVLYARLEEDAK